MISNRRRKAAVAGLLLTASLLSACGPKAKPALRDPIIFDQKDFSDLLESLSHNPDAQYFLSEQKLAALSRNERNLDALNAFRASLLHKQIRRRFAIRLDAQQSAVKSLITEVSLQHGLDPTYFHGLARRESSFNPFAGAGTSSARGLWQFTDNTWLCALRQYGPRYGLAAADQIYVDSRGRCAVNDTRTRIWLLSLRYNQAFSTHIVIAHTLDNRAFLKMHGIIATQADLYALHFLGQGDGLKFLRADPNAIGAAILPAAAASNPSVFFDRGRPRRVWEIYSSFYSL